MKIYDECLILFIEKATTDQYRNSNEVLISKGNTVACPFSMFNKYLTISEIALGSKIFLFRPIFRSKNVCKLIYKNKKLSYTAARQSIISRLKLVSKDLNFGLHSVRSGGATAVANTNINEKYGKRHGRWKSDTNKDGYTINSVVNRLEFTKKLGIFTSKLPLNFNYG